MIHHHRKVHTHTMSALGLIVINNNYQRTKQGCGETVPAANRVPL